MILFGVFALTLIFNASAQSEYEAVGCYNDDRSRSLPVFLKSYRETIVWKNRLESFKRIIKECANLAYSGKYLYFAIQYYGECWTGRDAYKTFDEKGKSEKCTKGKDGEGMVGRAWTNFVYMITTNRSECSKKVYKELKERSRSIKVQSSSPSCDYYLLPKGRRTWFRFTEEAGNAMAMSAPRTNYCGTTHGGWIKDGSLPKDKGKPVNKEVCFRSIDNEGDVVSSCRDKVSIKVRNCGHFFVYELPRSPSCMERYCGDRISVKDY